MSDTLASTVHSAVWSLVVVLLICRKRLQKVDFGFDRAIRGGKGAGNGAASLGWEAKC